MEPITITIETAKEVYEAAKDLASSTSNIAKESFGKEEGSSIGDLKASENAKDSSPFVERLDYSNNIDTKNIEDVTFVEKFPEIEMETTDNPSNPTNAQLDKSQQFTFREEIDKPLEGATSLEGSAEELNSQNTMSDFSIPDEINNPDKYIENSNKLSLDKIEPDYPEVADALNDMEKRLGNNCPDGIMNTIEYYKTDDGSLIIKSNHPDYANSYIVIKGDNIYCKAGCLQNDQHPNEFINNAKLIPNSTYHVDGHFNYRTDGLGRVIQSQEQPTGALNQIDRHGDRGNLKPIAEAKDGRIDDIGGHMAANNVCGPTEAINIFPQNTDLNISKEWKQMENNIQNACSDGSSVHVTREFSYTGESMRPDVISIKTDIDGTVSKYEFKNESPSNS